MKKIDTLKLCFNLIKNLNKIDRKKFSLFEKYIGIPVKSGHVELSVISAPDNEPSRPNENLFNLSLEAIKNAQRIKLDDLKNRLANLNFDLNMWPGTHYRLLAGLVSALKPKIFVEIGTGSGISALTIQKFLPKDSKLVTFDIIPWNKYTNTHLKITDFNEFFIQYTNDLSKYSNVLKYKKLLKAATVFLIDAAKDGIMEYRLLANFKKVELQEGSILIFDDIKLWNMLAFWSNMTYPKIDLTSFGNWSGTGLIEWKNR